MPDDDEFYIDAEETLDFSEEETRISKNLDVRSKEIFLITIFAILVIGMLYFFSFYLRALLLIPKWRQNRGNNINQRKEVQISL